MEKNDYVEIFETKDGPKIHFENVPMGSSDGYTLIFEYDDGTFITAAKFMAVIGQEGKIGYPTKEAAMKKHEERQKERMEAVDFVRKFKEILKN